MIDREMRPFPGLLDIRPILTAADLALQSRGWSDTHARNIPYCALLHLNGCLAASAEANANGTHSVAACLLRQCVESLTLVELGLLDEPTGAVLVRDWHDHRKSTGELRRTLQSCIWPRYGSGLWNESWDDFFGNLAKAVQPYAHYSQQLMMWQIHAITPPRSKDGSDATFQFLARVGPSPEDREKTTQITVLQGLVVWALGRLIVSNTPAVVDDAFRSTLDELRVSITTSGFLLEGAQWSDLLVPVVGQGG